MPESPSDRHNRLSHKFVVEFAGEVLKGGGGYAEVMTVLESVILSTMLMNEKAFGLSPQVSSGLVEAAAQRALERYTELPRT